MTQTAKSIGEEEREKVVHYGGLVWETLEEALGKTTAAVVRHFVEDGGADLGRGLGGLERSLLGLHKLFGKGAGALVEEYISTRMEEKFRAQGVLRKSEARQLSH